MKKELLAGTALAGSAALIAGAAMAAEAPTWKLTGNANFQFYWVDQDATNVDTWRTVDATGDLGYGTSVSRVAVTWMTKWTNVVSSEAVGAQDHDWYFGVDEAELQLNVSGTADNGLNYGFKIEINALTTDNTVADEVRLQLSGGWGTLQMGDEDGAEDIMNYGGENLMGATGGFDGDQDDYLLLCTEDGTKCVGDFQEYYLATDDLNSVIFDIYWMNGNKMNMHAPTYPTIAGDTSDQTKISYFSPRFSGFQFGASLTPTPNNGDDFKQDGSWENHIGLGANYDNSFGDLRIRASAVYSHASNADDEFEDISAWSVGGIVGWGPFSLGANYTDNGDSGQPLVWEAASGVTMTAPIETSYWNVAAGFETGPMYFSAGYFVGTADLSGLPLLDDSTYEHIALTADYTVAPGLGVYAEINLISDELMGGALANDNSEGLTNDTTSLVMGVNVSF